MRSSVFDSADIDLNDWQPKMWLDPDRVKVGDIVVGYESEDGIALMHRIIEAHDAFQGETETWNRRQLFTTERATNEDVIAWLERR